MNDAHARLWHRPRINHILRVMFHTNWSEIGSRMTLLTDLEAFVRDHRLHGGMTGDATPPPPVRGAVRCSIVAQQIHDSWRKLAESGGAGRRSVSRNPAWTVAIRANPAILRMGAASAPTHF